MPTEPSGPGMDEAVVIPAEFADAAIRALLRRKLGYLSAQANNATIAEAAGQATAVLGAIWPLIEERAADERAKVLREVAGLDVAADKWAGYARAQTAYRVALCDVADVVRALGAGR